MKSPLRSISIVFLAISIISCGGPGERIKEISKATPAPSATPGERELSGVFNVTGAGTNGIDPYNGVLTVAPKGQNYEFRWATTKGSLIGTGVQLGTAAAASYSATGGGKGCGVVLYKIASDGSLDGRIARWGDDKFGTEKAVRTEGTGFVGKYSVNLTETDGRPFAGTLSITKDGAGYDFEWNTGSTQVGFGTWKGSTAAVSFGGKQCSFVLYDIQSNGSFDGTWGGQRSVTFGTESSKRK
ncbi:hypothetical protein BH10ACI3_BH10ACI3_28850 [soil metagenome]